MNNRTIIFIPEDAEDIPFVYFPISNNLQNFLRREKIKIVGDLNKISDEILGEILFNKKKPFSELKELIFAIQKTDSKEIIITEEENSLEIVSETSYFSASDESEEFINEAEPLKTLNDLLKFFNDFAGEIKGIDRTIFLGRLGSNPDEKVVTMAKISGECKISLDFIAQLMAACINEINTTIGYEGDDILNKLRNDCYENFCLLTPKFLIYLTNNDYNLFLHPPAFYIRLIGLLSTEIPVLPEATDKIKYLKKDATKMSSQIKKILQNQVLPLALSDVFSYLSSNFIDKNLTKIFFEAVQSPKFNLIQGDQPNELFIELKN